MQPPKYSPPTPPLPLKEAIASIYNLHTPIIYKKLHSSGSTHLPRVLIFGDIQSGKSTLGNYILRESIIDKNNLKTPKGGWFPTKRQSTAVTTSITFKNTDTMFLIDTCGFNNIDNQEISNEMNSMEILETAKNLFNHKTYINGFIFTIMAKKCLTIEEKSVMS